MRATRRQDAGAPKKKRARRARTKHEHEYRAKH